MAPRHQTLPPAQTQAAKNAIQSFFCQLCSKGYSRVNDYEAHLSSYDHSHRQRMKDMKAMVKDPLAIERARRAEAKLDGIISIKHDNGPTTSDTPSGGFKKCGFKKSIGGTSLKTTGTSSITSVLPKGLDISASQNADDSTHITEPQGEWSSDDDFYDRYDPNKPTP